MDESTNVKKEKQVHQKPLLSFGRIASEIIAGAVMGFAFAVPVSIAIVFVFLCMFFGRPADWPEKGEWGLFGFAVVGIFVFSFLILYGPATVAGVYLVGSRGKQTGSFLATAGGLFLALPVIALLFLYQDMAESKGLEVVKIILWLLIFLAAPIGATLGFNLTRRYKKPPSP